MLLAPYQSESDLIESILANPSLLRFELPLEGLENSPTDKDGKPRLLTMYNQFADSIHKHGSIIVTGFCYNENHGDDDECPDFNAYNASLKNMIKLENWLHLAPFLAFFRANESHPFRNSIKPLLSQIARITCNSLVHDIAKSVPHTIPIINLDKFINTIFVTSHLNNNIKNNNNKRKNVICLE